MFMYLFCANAAGNAEARPKPWWAVAVAIYKDDSDSKMLAIYRLHGRVLNSLQGIMRGEETTE